MIAIFIGCDFVKANILLDQGTALLNKGEYDQAIAKFNKAIELYTLRKL